MFTLCTKIKDKEEYETKSTTKRALEIMIEKHYFKALFLYLDPEVKDKVQTVSKWTAAQLVEL